MVIETQKMSVSFLEIKLVALSAFMTVAACLSNTCDATNVSIHSVADADRRVALETSIGTNAADATEEDCRLRSWYDDVLAEGLLSGAHREEDKTSFQEHIGELLSADKDMMVSCDELDSYYNEFIMWRDEENQEDKYVDGEFSDQVESPSVSYRPAIHKSTDWFSTLDGCSLSSNHSHTACYYVAISQRVCLNNISDDSKRVDTGQSQRSDVDVDTTTVQPGSFVGNDVNKRSTVNNATQRSDQTNSLSTDLGESGDVQANSGVPASNASTAANNSTHKRRTDGELDHRLTRPVGPHRPDTTSTRQSYDWFSIMDTCSLCSNRSYTLCYYVAICQHVCFNNLSRDAGLQQGSSSSVNATTVLSSGSKDKTDSTTTANDATEENRQLKPVSIDSDALSQEVQANSSVLATAVSNSSAASNATRKQSPPTENKGTQTTSKATSTKVKREPTKSKTREDNTSSTSVQVNKTTTTTTTAARSTSKSSDVKSNVTAAAKENAGDVRSSKVAVNTTKGQDVVKSNAASSNKTEQKSATSKTDSRNSTSATNVTTEKQSGVGLSQRDETDFAESSASDTMTATPATNGQANDGSHRNTDDMGVAKTHPAPDGDSDRARSENTHKVEQDQREQQLRLMEIKMLQLENQLLQSTVDRSSTASSTVQLENYIMRLERELTRLNYSFVELKAENEQLRQQRNAEMTAASKNDSALASVGNQLHKIAELIDFVNNQSSVLVTLQDKYDEMERKNRLLVDQVLNQSLMMNHIMLHVDTLSREQMKHTTQLTELKESSKENNKSFEDSQDSRQISHHAQVPSDEIVHRSNYSDIPKDCYDHYEAGQHEDAVLTVRFAHQVNDIIDISVFCDMTDHGWTVIQRRLDGSQDFYRSWNDYKLGFGSINDEHWLGNDYIHQLTSQDQYSLRVSLTDWNDLTHVVDYDKFRLTDELDGYRLHVAGYHERPDESGGGVVAGDSLLKHNGYKFSTFDVDNDLVERDFEHGSCARRFTGAWWYYKCYMSNLNGRYYPGGTVPDRLYDGVAWKSWTGSRYSLKEVEMKIRPLRAGPT